MNLADISYACPASDPKGHVLDDLALGRGGRLLKGSGWKMGNLAVRDLHDDDDHHVSPIFALVTSQHTHVSRYTIHTQTLACG